MKDSFSVVLPEVSYFFPAKDFFKIFLTQLKGLRAENVTSVQLLKLSIVILGYTKTFFIWFDLIWKGAAEHIKLYVLEIINWLSKNDRQFGVPSALY